MAKTAAKSTKSQACWQQKLKYVASSPYLYTHVFVEKAQGAVLTDVDGKQYLDFAGGIGALNVGHRHPAVVAAVRRQLDKVMHTCYHVAPYEGYTEVCRKLAEVTPGRFPKKAVLFNSGAEAVENAIKIARAYTKRPAVISFDLAFHGRTMLAMTLTGKVRPYRSGFGPYPSGVYHAPYPYAYRRPPGVPAECLTEYCLAALEKMFVVEAPAEQVAAIIVEPIQGEGGFIVPTPGFLEGLRKICDQHGICLILDEIQSGFGRTGKMWGCDHFNVAPDLITTAKSLAGGLPLSGVVGRADMLDAVHEGGLGGTFGGNPLACAAALAVFDIFEKENLVARGHKIGQIIKKRFDALAKKYDFVGDSRGLGPMRAVELVRNPKTKEPIKERDARWILERCVAKGLIILKAGSHNNVFRTLVPLVITAEQLTRGLDIFDEVLREFNPT